MSESKPSYRGDRLPPPIISHAVWLYYRFALSFRDVENLLAERGVGEAQVVDPRNLLLDRDVTNSVRRVEVRSGKNLPST